MNDSKTAFKSRGQLVKFLGIFSPHISKPTDGAARRWRVEDTLRYIKTPCSVEHVRVLDYQRLKNMAALIAAVAYFAAAWLGRQLKLGVLAEHIAKVSRRMFDVPEFFY